MAHLDPASRDTFAEQLSETPSTLKPASNVRRVIPRVCATCAYGRIEDGAFFCLRQDGYGVDAGDLTQWLTVCDRYTRESL